MIHCIHLAQTRLGQGVHSFQLRRTASKASIACRRWDSVTSWSLKQSAAPRVNAASTFSFSTGARSAVISAPAG